MRCWLDRAGQKNQNAGMAKKKKSALAETITLGQYKAGTIKLLIEALGEPRLPERTVEGWQQGRNPPRYVAGMVIERIERYLKKEK